MLNYFSLEQYEGGVAVIRNGEKVGIENILNLLNNQVELAHLLHAVLETQGSFTIPLEVLQRTPSTFSLVKTDDVKTQSITYALVKDTDES